MALVKLPRVAPTGAAAVAALWFPAGIATHEHLEHMPALDQHQYRRIQRRQQGFQQDACGDADDAAAAAPNPRREQAADQPEHLGYQKNHHAEPEQRHHQLHVEPRPGRKELEIMVEVFRTDQVRLHRQRKSDSQHQQPQRRGEIAHDADAEVQPAGETTGPPCR